MTRECRICGREFDSAKGISTHFRHQHDNKPWLPEDQLQQLYQEEGLSQREIAERFDTSQLPVQRAMKKYGIESQKSNSNPSHPPNHKFDRKYHTVGSEYEQIQITVDSQPHTVSIHRLIALAHGKMSVGDFHDEDVVIHHKTGHGLDNRPENLEVMKRADHSSHHMEERQRR